MQKGAELIDIKVIKSPNFIKKAKQLDHELETVTKRTANNIFAEVKRTTPVRTGNLRRGWKKNKTGKWEWTVNNDVEYGPCVEFGTRKMKGRHMLGNAMHKEEPNFHRQIRSAVKKALMA